MTEKQRQNVLLGILGTAVAVWLIGPMLKSTFVDPITESENAVESAQTKYDAAADAELLAAKQRKSLRDYSARSLPRNRLRALDVYNTWIRRVANQSNLTIEELTPNAASGGKRGVYETVQVSIEATGTMKELRDFMYRFYQVDLMHRITRLRIDCDDSESPSAPMAVELTAEGLCLLDAADREDLFPKSDVTSEIDEDADIIKLASVEDFPTEPGFLCMVDTELVKVKEIDGTELKVERAAEGTTAVAHTEDAVVELFPVDPEKADISVDKYNSLVEYSFFSQPIPERTFQPRLAKISDRKIKPGDKFTAGARMTGLDPKLGKATYKFEEGAPEGMKIDEASGAITWQTDDKTEAKKYDVVVVASQAQNPALKKTEDFAVTIEMTNEAPKLTVEKEHKAYIGSSMTFQATATDDGDAKDLTFELENAPNGATIDPTTGKFEWDISTDMSPGDYRVTVSVYDAGEKSASSQVTLTAMDDIAKYTSMTGFIDRGDGKASVWLRNKLTGDELTIFKGDKIEVADVKGTVTEIASNSMMLTTEKGLWKMVVGENLRSMTLLEPAKEKAPEPAEEEDGEKTDDAKNSNDKASDETKEGDTDTTE